MPALEVRDVWKTYDRVRFVLEAVSLGVRAGELVVVMGRSGSGKTTLLNVMAGLDRPTRGDVRVQDVALGALDEQALTDLRLRRIGIVFQRFHLIPELTMAENIRLPLQLAKRRDAHDRSRELMGFFGIAEQADAFPATLSGGEAQRAAMARALANEPAVLLADEPTANLDQENARLVLGEMRRVRDELDTAVLIASHDPMAESVADRVHRIVDGRLDHHGGQAPTRQGRGPASGPPKGQRPRWPT